MQAILLASRETQAGKEDAVNEGQELPYTYFSMLSRLFFTSSSVNSKF